MWLKLDNAGKLFPAVSSQQNTSVFRIAALLRQEVDPLVLQATLSRVIQRFPMFQVRLRNGLFWRYFEPITEPLLIEEEKNTPCSKLSQQPHGYLLRVTYYQRRIALEMHHSLTDGLGSVEFFKCLLYYYLVAQGHSLPFRGEIKGLGDAASAEESQDSYHHYRSGHPAKEVKAEKAYHLKGTPYQFAETSAYHGVLKVDQLSHIAKNHQVSLTTYLLAVLIYSLYHSGQPGKGPIVMAVPVNLRTLFPSQTLRNFFTVVNVSLSVTPEMTLAEIIREVQRQLKKQLKRSYLQQLIDGNTQLETRWWSRFTPLWLKDRVIKLGFDHLGENRKTMTLSNLGKVELPSEMASHIEQFEVLPYPTAKSPLNCGIISFGNQLTVSFIKSIEEEDVIRYFYRYLSQTIGLEVVIYGNER